MGFGFDKTSIKHLYQVIGFVVYLFVDKRIRQQPPYPVILKGTFIHGKDPTGLLSTDSFICGRR